MSKEKRRKIGKREGRKEGKRKEGIKKGRGGELEVREEERKDREKKS